jgi:hypothetical protein
MCVDQGDMDQNKMSMALAPSEKNRVNLGDWEQPFYNKEFVKWRLTIIESS